jgi:ribosomal protein S18 acetylase RimI-like enzyme
VIVVRDAVGGDVAGVCGFGAEHVPPHYAPLIGAEAAEDQVRRWWNAAEIGRAVAEGLVVVAEVESGGAGGHDSGREGAGGRDSGRPGEVVGVGQRGRRGDDHVVYKLYVHPDFRGRGIGPRLIDALIGHLPPDADRLYIEHFVGNGRAGAFYEREGFTVDRIEPGPSGDPARGVVWRVRRLP